MTLRELRNEVAEDLSLPAEPPDSDDGDAVGPRARAATRGGGED
jgi:hypothetical protein